MPKHGFTGLTVSVSLRQRLNEAAEAFGFSSVPALLESLLAGTCTCNSTALAPKGFGSRETGFKRGCFSKSGWCGGWDLNPRRPSPEDLKSSPLS
jgi:hypothetical protein